MCVLPKNTECWIDVGWVAWCVSACLPAPRWCAHSLGSVQINDTTVRNGTHKSNHPPPPQHRHQPHRTQRRVLLPTDQPTAKGLVTNLLCIIGISPSAQRAAPKGCSFKNRNPVDQDNPVFQAKHFILLQRAEGLS